MTARQFEITADEPARVGGTDTGPMPTEIFLASLASCFALAVAHAARKRGVELPDLAVTVRGEYAGLKFGRIRVEVHASHDPEQLDAFIRRAVSYCYVSNTLAHRPEIEYVAAPPVSHAPPPPPG